MPPLAIRVERLSKQYHLGGGPRGGYRTLREALADGVRGRLARLRRRGRAAVAADAADTLWALRDVSFDVRAGDVVGVIGRNGSGKSTLLKVLSRVVEPTAGRAELTGRVGSLLEVGTGFHPELTGRENVYLSGAILGMSRAEIGRKFDEIAAFSEVERFLDTPVKRYSSGMYTRLAFAVAAHLEPEILIVDEVLAVGDAAFQKKCLGKMGAVAKDGRTVLFVSHNMNAVQRLCRQAVLLDRGRLVAGGDTPDVVARYLAAGVERSVPEQTVPVQGGRRGGPSDARFTAVRYSSQNPAVAGYPYADGPLVVTAVIESSYAGPVQSASVVICDRAGTKLVNADSLILGRPLTLAKGRTEVTFRIHQLHLKPGVYVAGLWLAAHAQRVLDHVESAFEIEVVENPTRAVQARPVGDGTVTCPFDVEVAAAEAPA
jgi:ABC-type polysaccharide/polyol phosphate transport system ATPase subunit